MKGYVKEGWLTPYPQRSCERYGRKGWKACLHRPCGNIVDFDHYEVYRIGTAERGFTLLRRWYTNDTDIIKNIRELLVKIFTSKKNRVFFAEYAKEETARWAIAHLASREQQFTTELKGIYTLSSVYFPEIDFNAVYNTALNEALEELKSKYPECFWDIEE